MDGERIRKYWNSEMTAMMDIYRQFETLVPAKEGYGAAHRGEDGRFVETLIRIGLSRFLPKELEVLTGFILRPAVKAGTGKRKRSKGEDIASTQLDIIIYNTARYPVYQRFGDYVVVPPEGVVGVISVKKTLSLMDIEKETAALAAVGHLCVASNSEQEVRGPFLGLVGFQSNIKNSKKLPVERKVFERLCKAFPVKGRNRYDWLPGYVGVLSDWSLHKRKPGTQNRAEYLFFKHKEDEMHMGFQFLIHDILGVYYDKSRGGNGGIGYTAFQSGRGCDKRAGFIEYQKLRGDW